MMIFVIIIITIIIVVVVVVIIRGMQVSMSKHILNVWVGWFAYFPLNYFLICQLNKLPHHKFQTKTHPDRY